MSVGDGWCDDINNVAECYFDAGDCCFNVNPEFCTKCECYENGKPWILQKLPSDNNELKSFFLIKLPGGQTISFATETTYLNCNNCQWFLTN